MREGFKNFGLTSDPSNPNRIFQFHLGGVVSDILVDIPAGETKPGQNFVVANFPYIAFCIVRLKCVTRFHWVVFGCVDTMK